APLMTTARASTSAVRVLPFAINMTPNTPFPRAAACAELNPPAVASSAAKQTAALRVESIRAGGTCAASGDPDQAGEEAAEQSQDPQLLVGLQSYERVIDYRSRHWQVLLRRRIRKGTRVSCDNFSRQGVYIDSPLPQNLDPVVSVDNGPVRPGTKGLRLSRPE